MVRRFGALILPAFLVLAWSATGSSASGGSVRYVGLERAVAWQRAHEAAMHARATQRSGGPLVHWTGSEAGAFHASHVQQASEDTLPPFSSSQPDTQVEPDITVDPNHPTDVVATFQQGRFADGGSVDPGYATSLDGGLHWADGNLPALTQAVGGPFERSSDPAVADGPDGSVYIVTIPFDQTTDCRSAVSIQRSDDHGLTFHAPVLVQDDNSCRFFNDKEWVTVDTSRSSPFFGRVYVVWSRFGVNGAPAELRYSDDQGQTWSGLIDISPSTALTEGCLPLVQPNGDLTVVYDLTVTASTHPKDHEVSQTSHDGPAGGHWRGSTPTPRTAT